MLVFVSLLEEFHSFFLVMLSGEHHVRVNDQNTMPDRYCGPLLAASFRNPSLVFPQVGLRATCCMGRLNQRRAQPAIAFACPTGSPVCLHSHVAQDTSQPTRPGVHHQESDSYPSPPRLAGRTRSAG